MFKPALALSAMLSIFAPSVTAAEEPEEVADSMDRLVAESSETATARDPVRLAGCLPRLGWLQHVTEGSVLSIAS
jgi:hypothetical protein